MNKIYVGFLNPSLGRYKKGLPNTNDLIHLGNNVIKRFKLNINNKIMHKHQINTKISMKHKILILISLL